MFSFQVKFPVASFYCMVAKLERYVPIKHSVPPGRLLIQAHSTTATSATPSEQCSTLLSPYSYLTFGEPPARRGLVLTGLTSLDGVRQCEPADFPSASESSIHGHQGDGRPRRRQYRHVVTSRNGRDKRCRSAETAIACRDGAG
jgi:hypothetical protein